MHLEPARMTELAIDRFGALELFCAAARASSFTAAATSLGATPSAVSKAVSRLERRLGVKLFERTTRAIRLTADGRAYFLACEQALDTVAQVESSFERSRPAPRGTLRISLPPSYGLKRVIPRIPAFVERHGGKLKVIVSLSNAVTDFVAEGVDMSIRLGAVTESSLVVRHLHDAPYVVVASPDYLGRKGVPRRPEDLALHQGIGLTMPDTNRSLRWEFRDGWQTREVRVASQLEFDHPLAALSAALHGGGLARLLDFTVEDELRTGRLVEVLAGYRPEAVPVSVVYPTRRHLSVNVRTFIDYLAGELGPITPGTSSST